MSTRQEAGSPRRLGGAQPPLGHRRTCWDGADLGGGVTGDEGFWIIVKTSHGAGGLGLISTY